MAKKQAEILALDDTKGKDAYDISGLAGLVKSKFIDSENARKFDEQRWLRAYRNIEVSMEMIWLLLKVKNQKYLLK